MFSSFRDRFGTAGLVVAVIALVLAVAGTAYAATKLNATQKKEVEKIAKKFAGKPGANGANGANGTNGANGKDGAQGAEGKEGKQGLEGKQGKEGKQGLEGKEGSPWTAGGTLPSGKTETGTWTAQAPPIVESIEVPVPISFPIPLAKGGNAEEEKVFFFTPEQVTEQEFTNGCKWEQENISAKPESTTPGVLCVFEQIGAEDLNFNFFQPPGEPSAAGYAPSGTVMYLTKVSTPTPGFLTATGTWAVTAP